MSRDSRSAMTLGALTCHVLISAASGPFSCRKSSVPEVEAITSAFTLDGSRSRYSMEVQPPMDCATMLNSFKPSSATSAARSSAYDSGAFSPGTAVDGEKPRCAKLTQVYFALKCATCCHQDIWLPPRPCANTSAGPLPYTS